MFDVTATEGIITSLVALLAGALQYERTRQRKHEKQCRDDAKICHEKIETLLTTLVTEANDRGARLENFGHSLKTSYDHQATAISEMGSDYHKAITLKRKRRR